MIINILLPYKEKFDLFEASSVSITVKNNLKYSVFKKNIIVFGRTVNNPIYEDNFHGISNSKVPFRSRNKHLALQMSKRIKDSEIRNQLVEIHNRPYLLKYLYKVLKNYPISIFFHNNPLEMKGSRRLEERKFLIENAAGIFCVSEFIKTQFLNGLNNKKNNVHVLHNGVDSKLKNFPQKNKEILYVGKIIPEKGVDIYVNAVSKLIKKFPDWDFFIIGSGKTNKVKDSKFADNLLGYFNNLGLNAHVIGFLTNEEVKLKMEKASIMVIPSIWQEPFGLVVSEAMSNGMAIIASDVGGIPEILKDNGILIKDINSHKLEENLENILNNSSKLLNLQRMSWNNFKLNSRQSSKKLDTFRSNIIKSFFL